MSYTCGYCGKDFTKEKTLAVHVCEKKRRHLARNEKHVQAALIAYQKFYEIVQKAKKPKTFDEFVESPYYNAFVKFGSFLVNANPIQPERFIDFVVRSGVKLDHWCRDELYETYLLDFVKKESADGAIQRTISTMLEWAEANGSTWEHYFLYVSLNRATHDIKEGLISPWILLNCASGRSLLQKLNNEQIEIISAVLDPDHWRRRFMAVPADLELVKEVLKEAKVP
jgi:DNA-directed RNA polymerase subunit RPC12/RpoP